jgi:hypothetical protein
MASYFFSSNHSMFNFSSWSVSFLYKIFQNTVYSKSRVHVTYMNITLQDVIPVCYA